jgi:hypothetical protein
MRFRVSSLLWLTIAVAVYMATVVSFRPAGVAVSGPQVLDAIVLLAAWGADFFYGRQGWKTPQYLWRGVAGAAMVVSLPLVLFDSSLPTAASKLETLWATGILALIAGIFASLVYCWLAWHKRSWIVVAMSAVFVSVVLIELYASTFLEVYPRWSLTFSVPDRSRSGRIHVRLNQARGELTAVMPYHPPRPELNYFRAQSGHLIRVSSGAKLFRRPLTLGYVHSSRDGGDFGAGPRMGVEFSYPWLLALPIVGVLIGAVRYWRWRSEIRGGQPRLGSGG